MRMCAPNFNRSRDSRKEQTKGRWGQMRVEGGQTEHRSCCCTAALLSVTGGLKKIIKAVVKGVFFPFYLSQPQDKMVQQPDSGPSQNNSRKCQTSVREMRAGEVRSTFSGPPAPAAPHHTTLPTRQVEGKQPAKTATLSLSLSTLSLHILLCA